MFSEIPSFGVARRFAIALLVLGLLFAVLGLVVFEFASRGQIWFTQLPVPITIGYLGAAFGVSAAGFLSAALIAFARHAELAAELAPPLKPTPSRYDPQTGWRKIYAALLVQLQRQSHWIPGPAILSGWPQSLAAGLLGAVTIWLIVKLWQAGPILSDPALVLQISGAALIALAFPLLVIERFYANTSRELLPEASQVERLLRVPLTASLGLAISALLVSAGFGWARYLSYLVVLLVLAVGAELVLRCAVLLFVPYAPMETRRAAADSSVARVFLRLTIPNIRTINTSVQNTLGIDLSRSWALAFVRQAALPVLAVLGIFSWCITGITGLNASERGIYERLGTPVAVLGPGIHLHLPWPFGSVRLAEYGVIHELPIEFVLPGGEAESHEAEATQAGAEGPPPAEADRLWSDAHPFEGSYLIAHDVDGKQSFQLVDIDMTVIYRVGLTDEDVKKAAYNVANADELIQAVSGRLVTQYFVRHTLLDVIGSSREVFTRQFQQELQTELDNASSGIEVMTVSIEAVHPPPGAADAYHNVQAAGIRAETAVFTSRGNATRQVNAAQLAVDSEHNTSVARAEELVAQAKTDSILFEADRKAFAVAGRGFLLERWLENLTKALGGSVPLILVDHRLQGDNVPIVDLRGLGLNGPANGQGNGANAGNQDGGFSNRDVLPGYESLQDPSYLDDDER